MLFLEEFVKRKSLTLVILGLLLASCSLLDKFKTPDDPEASVPTVDATPVAQAEAPTTVAEKKDDLDVLANAVDADTSHKPASEAEKLVVQTETPAEAPKVAKSEEAMPEIKNEPIADSSEPQKIKFYKVKKGETLMQIAFKIYGDVSRWKDLKKLNQEKVSRNTALATNMTLKYAAPSKEFVWNPEGIAYLIKNGETLGIISSNVYHTPTKWKNIWENNKPLIKNPNIIYSGFTLYYKNDGLANYVQPKPVEKADTAGLEKVDVAQELLKADEAAKAKTEEATKTAEREVSSEKKDSTL